ncbi:unnamed protein product [Protopolystoma xenopodis]|uniref:Transmembrane protein n=1 Tax=Protopolystoma xenopodis TaxID=117903 RepID=A0A448WT02_9PLAT|nr:unnamed protein product [Protopolystoma xenopodis]
MIKAESVLSLRQFCCYFVNVLSLSLSLSVSLSRTFSVSGLRYSRHLPRLSRKMGSRGDDRKCLRELGRLVVWPDFFFGQLTCLILSFLPACRFAFSRLPFSPLFRCRSQSVPFALRELGTTRLIGLSCTKDCIPLASSHNMKPTPRWNCVTEADKHLILYHFSYAHSTTGSQETVCPIPYFAGAFFHCLSLIC